MEVDECPFCSKIGQLEPQNDSECRKTANGKEEIAYVLDLLWFIQSLLACRNYNNQRGKSSLNINVIASSWFCPHLNKSDNNCFN